MFAHRNTPTLSFEANTPVPTPAELAEVTAYFVDAARISAGDSDATASVLAQAAGSLVLVSFFAWERPPTYMRSLRGQLRSARHAQRSWYRTFGQFLLAIALVACGDARELEPVDVDAGDELPAPSCEEPSEPVNVPPAELEPDLLAMDAPACTGHWVDNSDVSTRLDAHPDTGKCTFACVWQEPKCRESWYGDPRCFPAHAAHLGMLCAELGGRCERAQADGLPYCVAR